MARFTHLHLHTDASLKDGLGAVARTVQRAKSVGFDKLAMTDHGTLANAIAFTLECKAAGVKPILGVEGYVRVDNEVGHLTLLADGAEGWANLVKLNNLGHASEGRAPAFTVDQLVDHADGIVLLSGCVSSPLNKMSMGDALSLGARLKTAFGPRMFAEVMFIADVDTWSRPLEIAERLKLRTVMTNDVHFANQQDAEIHSILTHMKAGYEYDSDQLWLKTPAEMWWRAKSLGMTKEQVKSWMDMADKIAARITEVDLAREPSLPHVADAMATLRRLVQEGAETHAFADGHTPAEYLERARYELKVIEEMDYPTYFVILRDILNNARERGIRIGAGRGSGAGSVVLWLLGITQIDPIKYNLSFERFLNPERRGMPDVDVDIESERREDVLSYAAEKYGAIPIATYSRYTHKVLVHDLARQMKIAKPIEEAAAEMGDESDEFTDLRSARPDFAQAYDAIKEQIRHKGKHAGGVIITDTNVPIERTGNVLAAAWSEGRHNELSYAGIVKFDLLGLSALSTLSRMERMAGTKAPEPTYDAPEFQLFRDGDLAGIFQFSGSPGIRDLTMRMQPRQFEDLVAINALFRPGALDAGTALKYPEYKEKPRDVPPLFDDILKSTYGVVVFQEQMMQVIQRAIGGTYGAADNARRIITKGGKKEDAESRAAMEALKELFAAGCTSQGMSKREANEWWGEMETHGRYSFNRAHAVAYSMIAWQTAWWRYNYPGLFFAQMLNVDPSQSQTYIAAALDAGLEVSMPKVDKSGVEWTSHDNTLYVPLVAVKFLGETGAKTIVAQRPDGGFASIEQFMQLCPKKVVRGQAREGLWYLGAFSETPGEFKELQLGRKKTVEKYMSRVEAMRKFLGFVVPPPHIAEVMNKYRAKGWIVGVVDKIKPKESRYGKYFVYYLDPTGVFWLRDELDIQPGMIVAAKMAARGKAKNVEVLLR